MGHLSSVHVSQIGYGGAWNALVRINESLSTIGLNSVTESELPKGNHSGITISKCLSRADLEVQKLSNASITTSTFRGSGNQSWYRYLLEKHSDKNIWNMHWIPGLPNNELLRVFREKNVVWTMHDMNPFTGICHYNMSCENFKSNCEKCPQVIRPLRFVSKSILKEKYKMIREARNLVFVAPSFWIKKEFENSQIGSDVEVVRIPNPIPELFFSKKEPSLNKFLTITLLGSNYTSSKNSEISAIALRNFLDRNTSIPITIQIIGEPFKVLEPYRQICLEPNSSPSEIARFLQNSDLFIYTSLYDNLPNLVLEAQAAGNIVLSFKVGGITECYKDKVSGFTVSENLEDFGKAISLLVSEPETLERMKKKASEYVGKHFSMDRVGNQYLELYEEMLRRE